MTTGTPSSTTPQTRKSGWRRFLQTVVLTSVIVTGGLSVLRFLGVFESSEIAVYDRLIRIKPVEPLDDRLLVIGIGEADIQGREEYPIQEGTVIELIEALEQSQPRAIALDFALDFPQGTDAERAELSTLLANSNRIVSACLMSTEQFPGVPPGPGISPELVAFADFPQDQDGVIRRTLMISTPGEVFVDEVSRSHLCNQPGEELLSLSFLLALIYLEDEGIFPEQTDAGNLRWESTVVPRLSPRSGGYVDNGAVDYQLMLNYRAPRNAVRQVSLTEVLEGRVDPAWIRDRVVLIGYTSPVVNDIFTTPYQETTEGFRGMPGVVMHAQATSQLISAVLEGRPLIASWPELGELLLIGLGSLLGGTLAYFVRRTGLLMVATVGVVIVITAGTYAVFLQGLWLPLVPVAIAVIVTAVAVSLVGQARQSVYAQAIFEQLKAEMTGRAVQGAAASRRDRVDDLVRRAQAIRQRQAIGTVLEQGDMDHQADDPMHMEFDSPEVQTFYEQIKSQLQQKFNEEKATLETQSQKSRTSQKSARLQSLLRKSQTARTTEPTPSTPASSSPNSSHD